MGISLRSYAAQRGVSDTAVRKAIATGRITTLPDGTIDPARADAEWGAHTDPAKQRGPNARHMAAATAAGTARATKPVPQAAIKAVADTLRDASADPGTGEAIRCATALEAADIPDDIPYRDELFLNKDEWVNQGDAVVYAPFGDMVAGPMCKAKGFLMAEIDVAAATASRRKLDASGHCARPDVFSLQVNRAVHVPARFT